MNLSINTPIGKYTYKFKIVYNGIKMIDKAAAKENLLLFNSIAKKKGLIWGVVYGTF